MPLACACQQINHIVQKTQNNIQNLLPKFPHRALLPDFFFWFIVRITHQKQAIVTDSRWERELSFKMKLVLVQC